MHSEMAEKTPKSTVRRHIDENLRRIYDETLNEQIPDKLTQLLEQLRQKSVLPDDTGEDPS
jgi:hypothetical protein